MISYDDEWVNPELVVKLTSQQKAKLTRARRKHYETISNYRIQIISKHFSAHLEHSIRITDTLYKEDIFVGEENTCSCNEVLQVTKKMLEDIHGGEYKLILTT